MPNVHLFYNYEAMQIGKYFWILGGAKIGNRLFIKDDFEGEDKDFCNYHNLTLQLTKIVILVSFKK